MRAVGSSAQALALLKAAAMGGWREAVPALDPGVTLDASLADEARVRARGIDPVLGELARWWPGEGTLLDWDEAVHADGALVSLERIDDGGRLRRLRLCVRWEDPTAIAALWAWQAEPRPEARATRAGPPDGVRERLEAAARAAVGDGAALAARRAAAGADWVGRATADPGREALLPHERLPSAIVAVEEDPDGGWWLLEHAPAGAPPAPGAVAAALAGMHGAFADLAPVAAACRLEDRLALHAPATAAAERGGRDLVPKQLEAGWECFDALAPAPLGDAVRGVLHDPASLAERLRAAEPATLLHGDPRPRLAAVAAGAVVLRDWRCATWGPAVLDAALAAAHAVEAGDGPPETAGERALAAFGAGAARALDLAALAVLADRGWRLGLDAVAHPDPARRAHARAALAWWAGRAERVRR